MLTIDFDIWSPRALAVLRIITSLLFTAHGLQKLLGFPVASPRGIAPPLSLMGVAGLIEIAGGLTMILGLFVRPTAFLLAGMMAVAYFIAHAPRSFFPIVNQGELAILFCFNFLLFSVAGGGRLWARKVRPEVKPMPFQ